MGLQFLAWFKWVRNERVKSCSVACVFRSIQLRSDKPYKISKNIFSINIHAQFAIVTKAKLDSIAVKGNCACDDLPPPPPKGKLF